MSKVQQLKDSSDTVIEVSIYCGGKNLKGYVGTCNTENQRPQAISKMVKSLCDALIANGLLSEEDKHEILCGNRHHGGAVK